MIDFLLVAISLGCGAANVMLDPSSWMVTLAVLSTGLVAAALVFRRVGLLVASAALAALCQTAALLSGAVSRVWEAVAFGFALLLLLELGWDRIRLVRSRLRPAAYARRLRYLAGCGAASAGATLVVVSLGYDAARRYGVSPSFGAAVACAAAISAAAAGLILLALKRRDSG